MQKVAGSGEEEVSKPFWMCKSPEAEKWLALRMHKKTTVLR